MKIIFCMAIIPLWSLIMGSTASAQDAVTKKLKSLVIPSLDLVDTPLSDALAFVQKKSAELDPAGNGVNVVILDPKLRDNRVTLRLNNTSLGDALRYTAMLGGGYIKKTRFAVTVSSRQTIRDEKPDLDHEQIETKLKSIILPGLEFYETPITDAIDFIAEKSEELDPGKHGINFIYHGDREVEGHTKVTLRLSKIPLNEVLGYTTKLTQHRFVLERNAIVITPL